MNVTVENVGPCKRLLRVEEDEQKVAEAWETVTRDFVKHAELPGFRPGKAPREMVVKRFEKQISEETKDRLIREVYKTAVKQQKLEVINILEVETIQFERGKPFQVAYTVEVAPQFELPEYHQLQVSVSQETVEEADVDSALARLQEKEATFRKVERPVTATDIAIVNATGTVDGVPVSEKLGQDFKFLDSFERYWVSAERDLAPGFFNQLTGAVAGEKRVVTVHYPADYPDKPLANVAVVFNVEISEVREKVTPALDDAFAQRYEAVSMEALRKGVRRDLENELTYRRRKGVQSQVVSHLLKQVHFEVPESLVQQETRMLVYDYVANLQRQGVSPEVIEQHKEKIYHDARQTGIQRVRLDFLVEAIAKKENLQVSTEDLAQRLTYMAYQRNVPPNKFLEEVNKSGEIHAIRQQLLQEKVLDHLEKSAVVTEVPPSAPSPEAAPPSGGPS